MKNTTSTLTIICLSLLLANCSPKANSAETNQKRFDGERAYQDVITQVELGPRPVGSEAHARVQDYIQSELSASGWQVETQETSNMGQPVKNIIAKRGTGNPWILLGAHYDTRLHADRDPNLTLRTEPSPGANDGASGVAVLLELARILPSDLPHQVWLVFFDAEDNGNIPGWEWILGSMAFVESLQAYPDAAIIVDMVGDADLNIYMEKNSDATLKQAIWQTAAELGYAEFFIPEEKHALLDDHTPFLRAGVPAVDIIDFNYPYWHTTQDTSDKVSAQSLQVVGETVFTWLQSWR